MLIKMHHPMKCIVLVLVSFLSFTTDADDAITTLKDRGSITFSYLDDEFPFSYMLAGKPTGMTIDLCESIAQRLGRDIAGKPLQVKWIRVPTAARLQSLVNHRSDIECSNITNTIERQKYFLFSVPYFYSSTTFISHKTNHILNKKMLFGRTIFVSSGDIAVQALSKLNEKLGNSLSYHLTQSSQSGFEHMKSTDGSVFVTDDVLLYSLRATSSNPEDYIISNDNLIEAQPLALAFSHDSVALKKAVNKVMVEIFSDGEFNRIYNKWFLSSIPPDNILINLPMQKRLKQYISK
jgi:glutamate/aspartate transport system substrate-binding protein